jgi:hypothetical protein
MTVLRRWPGEHYRPAAPTVELFPDFADTLTTGLDETVRNLKVLRERSRNDEESMRWQLKAFEDLQAEVLDLRKKMAGVIEAVNKRATTVAVGRFEKAFAERMDKRLDFWRTLACWAIGLQFMLIIAILTKVWK